jgi:hypothetical protein
MDAGLVIVIVVGVGGVLAIVLTGIRHEEIKLKLRLAASAADTSGASQANELSRLRDRVAVLEKLVTNDDRKLASDIEHLRYGDDAGRQA